MKRSHITILLLFLLVIGVLSQNNDDAKKMYKFAKMMQLKQQWTEAINIWQDLKTLFPSSKYIDDAQFWTAYCLEKNKTFNNAFMAYNEVIENYPNSSYVDDAMVHQIIIAEELVKKGQENYKAFIFERIEHENTNVKTQATFSLGRLGDKRSLPLLKALTNDSTYGSQAQEILELFKKKQTEKRLDSNPRDLTINVQKDVNSAANLEKKSRLFKYTKAHEQYKKMLKTGDFWTDEELTDFGMWYITPPSQFDDYYSLKGYDKQEWLRKFWKLMDPTPTTVENEAYDEFKRRVAFAKATYGEFWKWDKLKFLPDQHLVYDWPHAPWDARGELYIKYGEPDFNSVEDFNIERWIYHNLNISFKVHRYKTNIYHTAILPTPESSYFNNIGEIYSYIEKHQFFYRHKYGSAKLTDLKVSLNSNEGMIQFGYEFPSKKLKTMASEDEFITQFEECWVIFDDDLREIAREKSIQNERFESERKANRGQITRSVTKTLQQGDYVLALRIEDQNSETLGIYMTPFEVIEKE